MKTIRIMSRGLREASTPSIRRSSIRRSNQIQNCASASKTISQSSGTFCEKILVVRLLCVATQPRLEPLFEASDCKSSVLPLGPSPRILGSKHKRERPTRAVNGRSEATAGAQSPIFSPPLEPWCSLTQGKSFPARQSSDRSAGRPSVGGEGAPQQWQAGSPLCGAQALSCSARKVPS
jgi:hypothetical protein